MNKHVVAILESRTSAHMAELVERLGGTPLLAPALEEVADVDPAAISRLVASGHADPFKVAIFQTGVGARALFQATDSLGLTPELQALFTTCTVVVRGPKPVGELNTRAVAISRRAGAPFTTAKVLEALEGIELSNERVLVQRYGAENRELREGLEARGARVEEISTYRWELPADLGPLRRLLAALEQGRVDAVVFTSAVQVHNLFRVAKSSGAVDGLVNWLNGCVVASVGPVCSQAIREQGIRVTVEASPPKLGPLFASLDEAMRTVPPKQRH